MEQDRRDLFRKIGMLGASALALVSVSKPAKADDRNEQQKPLLGLWDLTIPPAGGFPVLYYKYAISEGAYVATGNEDANATFNGGYKYSPTMGTYARTGPLSYRIRERGWAYDANGNFAGYSDFEGSAEVAEAGNSWSGSGIYNQYDVNGKPVFPPANITYTAKRFSA